MRIIWQLRTRDLDSVHSRKCDTPFEKPIFNLGLNVSPKVKFSIKRCVESQGSRAHVSWCNHRTLAKTFYIGFLFITPSKKTKNPNRISRWDLHSIIKSHAQKPLTKCAFGCKSTWPQIFWNWNLFHIHWSQYILEGIIKRNVENHQYNVIVL